MRAWNENDRHHLQVSDTGVGIPSPVRKFVFDPLFTTTEIPTIRSDREWVALLALVKRRAGLWRHGATHRCGQGLRRA